MPLIDVRFLQKNQELLLQFDEGVAGRVMLSDLNSQANEITGLEPISPSQIKLYFDGAVNGVVFDARQLQELLQ